MKHIPDWPRLMSKATLARYLDITPTELEREVMQGRLPMPVKVGSRDHWSRSAVDASVETLTGERLDDWRKDQPLYGNS
ncbi:hypothetical protein GCM10007897_36810 [Sphingobium jiangsuense]|uniref:Putative DNA-binding transcriptional regulator AlpA n=1 Tax=Sphingobium jiangsuense TaxID=870476 RepID=A0A7W6BII9_9SPHN|nr:hypothetical protein [Sphingobium jiangsuense]MBB3927646.1 putative DNA-binding transcriptional regulator AlpA [Sphingobium jiangsuense]GLT02275.1 hypothetical protein GCM10007897_36810 [Sphingobium jiangsuense]